MAKDKAPKKQDTYDLLTPEEKRLVRSLMARSIEGELKRGDQSAMSVASINARTEEIAQTVLLVRGDGTAVGSANNRLATLNLQIGKDDIVAVEVHKLRTEGVSGPLVGPLDPDESVSISILRTGLPEDRLVVDSSGLVKKTAKGPRPDDQGQDCQLSKQVMAAVDKVLRDGKLSADEAHELMGIVNRAPNPQGKKNECSR